MDRRDAIRWMVAAATTAAVLDPFSFAAEPGVVVAKGYGTDPDLLKTYQPGEVWRLTLDEEAAGNRHRFVRRDHFPPTPRWSGRFAAQGTRLHRRVDQCALSGP
jgi:hypothetical protein